MTAEPLSTMSIKQNTVKQRISQRQRLGKFHKTQIIESFENWIPKNNKPHSNQKRNCSIYIHVIYRIRMGIIINDEIFSPSFSHTSHPLTFHFLFTFTFFIHFVRIYVTGKVNQQRQDRRNKKISSLLSWIRVRSFAEYFLRIFVKM